MILYSKTSKLIFNNRLQLAGIMPAPMSPYTPGMVAFTLSSPLSSSGLVLCSVNRSPRVNRHHQRGKCWQGSGGCTFSLINLSACRTEQSPPCSAALSEVVAATTKAVSDLRTERQRRESRAGTDAKVSALDFLGNTVTDSSGLYWEQGVLFQSDRGLGSHWLKSWRVPCPNDIHHPHRC
jgi:hypothetical protein